jgi:mono/diheme cytochrome c family protein
MSTGLLGVAFLVVGLTAMFLMYHLWGYPFDHKTHTSAAPKWAMTLHRVLGYLFGLIYVVMMWKMVPRLWQYQVEFPARTTIHIILGFTIGFLLIVKIAILRFFRHFEEWMPVLGTSIMLGTVILLGLSLPFVLQERALANGATSPESLARVAAMLPSASLPKEAPLAELSTDKALDSGRDVLLDKCVRCHDLKTILAKPRSPSGWWETVGRMAEKPALFAPISERDQWNVTAYLIAITPDLQKASKKVHDNTMARTNAIETSMKAIVAAPAATIPAGATAPDLGTAKAVFAKVCSQCHDTTDVDKSPPTTAAEAMALVQRMVKDNDAKLSAGEIESVTAYITAHYVAKTF